MSSKAKAVVMQFFAFLIAVLSGHVGSVTVPPACLHIPLSTSGQPVPVGYCPAK